MNSRSRSRDAALDASKGRCKKIVIISDGTGKTAKRLLDAVLAQYSQNRLDFSLVDIYHDIRDRKAFDRILQHLDSSYLVIFSIISEELSKYFHRSLAKKRILNINVLEPMLGVMSKFLGVHPEYRPGILQVMDDSYYKKVDAIGFTVEHDDGRGSLLGDADIVLVGLSRTCKTPISMYLACNFGVKVVNIPVLTYPQMEQNLLSRLTSVPKERIIGLMMQPDVLAKVREERSFYLANTPSSQSDIQDYYDVRVIRDELAFCRRLFSEQGWQTVDVTRRAIEEVAIEILAKIEYQTI